MYDFCANTYFPDVVYRHFFKCFQCHFKTSYSSFGVEATFKSLIKLNLSCQLKFAREDVTFSKQVLKLNLPYINIVMSSTTTKHSRDYSASSINYKGCGKEQMPFFTTESLVPWQTEVTGWALVTIITGGCHKTRHCVNDSHQKAGLIWTAWEDEGCRRRE